jgi:predicted ATP-dependent endonuclease of OLD family
MIKTISIDNFKSVRELRLDLGRVTVLIGENGSGKSNILESIALLGAAATDKLENEFLVSRGIRVTDASLMVSAFANQNNENNEEHANSVKLSAVSSSKKFFSLSLTPMKDRWSAVPRFNVNVNIKVEESEEDKEENTPAIETPDALLKELVRKLANPKFERTDKGIRIIVDDIKGRSDLSEDILKQLTESLSNQLKTNFYKWNRDEAEKDLHCSRFLIYAPENTARLLMQIILNS